MIRRIEALNFRCLQHVDIELDRFLVAVGPNASGKSALFDVPAFLGDLVQGGVETAVRRRTDNFQDLVWGRPKHPLRFELAVEFDIPEAARSLLPAEHGFGVFRYEVAISEENRRLQIEERGLLMPPPSPPCSRQRALFPLPLETVSSILQGGGRRGVRTILSKSPEGRTGFYSETHSQSGRGWNVAIALGAGRSALGNLPESPESLPVATYVRKVLTRGVTSLFLASEKMRAASPPHLGGVDFLPDGSNLPWIVDRLKRDDPDAYRAWIGHVRTTLEDLRDIQVRVRSDDRHAYLVLEHETNISVPSWAASDGTLRFLALTLLAYLPSSAVFLIEEPENGLHPFALDAVYDAFWSAHESQVLTATHSPAFLKLVPPEEILCFAKNQEGATDIVRGTEHPLLREWQGKADTELLFATGVIG